MSAGFCVDLIQTEAEDAGKKGGEFSTKGVDCLTTRLTQPVMRPYSVHLCASMSVCIYHLDNMAHRASDASL